MAVKGDYYQILGIPKGASEAEIKAAYRRLALEWHPDRNKTSEATQKVKEITEAYEILSNQEKRAAYDQFGHAAFSQGGFGAGGPFAGQTRTYRQGPFSYSYTTSGQGGFEGFDMGGFSDPFSIFEQFFGGASPFGEARQAHRPVYSIRIDFMEAVKGTEKEVRINGKVKKIKIPAGVDDGMRIRFDDFDLVIEITPHATFHRDGYDVYVNHSLAFPEAALGTIVKVPTIDGEVDLRIHPGTQPGALIRLRGPILNNLFGSSSPHI
ncbi:J domain-containing protein [Candidatus Gottesmanbacteria bacterium]|nr:J domain-containing protein [Candidatus Gottesmanbacteria bacterium]